jgi:flagellar M-ring protein FliF
LNELREQLQNIWNQMDTTRRIAAGVVLLLVLGSIIFVAVWANRVEYQLLYSSLSERDRSEIIVKLDEMKTPYRTTSGGGLEVPHALSVRANLLKEGIPRGGVVGWEIFDQNSFSTTDFTNQINRQRAIAGELTRTLLNINGIIDAKIMFNLPDAADYVFSDDKPDGSASIQLKLREQGILSEAQAESIANLVAASTGIKPENVTILDNYANDLTTFLRAGKSKKYKTGITSTEDLFSAKREYETTAEKRLEGMLTRVFGFNKAVVRVNAELDLDYQERKSETYGDQGVPRSEQEKSQSVTGADGNPVSGGVPGTDSNITQYQATDDQNNKFNSESNERTVNYEINKVDELRIVAPGQVKRQSVGVWVDGNLPETTKQKVENTVAAAIGIVEDRGDRVTVETIKFTLPQKVKEPPQAAPIIPWSQITLYLILAIFLGGLLSILRKILVVPHAAGRGQQVADGNDSEGNMIGSKIDLSEGRAQPEQAAAIEMTPEESARVERLQTIEKLAMEKPEEIAALLKNWISED